MKLLAILLLLSSCVPSQRYYMHTRQTLLHGSDAAIYAGCVRGVIRWHFDHAKRWPTQAAVEDHCLDVQKSFMDELRDVPSDT